MLDLIDCPHCGTPTFPASDLCHRCGEELPEYTKGGAIKCPNCLKSTSAVEETCRYCGKPIPEYLLAKNQEEIAKAAEKAKAAGEKMPPPAPKAAPPMEPQGTPQQTEVSSALFPLSARQEMTGRQTAKAAESAQAEAATTLPPEQPAPAPRHTKPRVVEKEPEPEAPPVPAKTRPVAPQAATMKLLIRRNQKTGMIRRRISFTIDARVELSPEMGALLKKYKLGKEVLYQNFTIIDPGSGLLGFITRWYFRHFAGVSVTVNDLVKGKHIECKDIIEMRVFEDRLKEACGTFKYMLDSAARFGGEEVIEL